MKTDWLLNGCINEAYYYWMLRLFTVQDDNLKFINDNNTAYRKFVSSGQEGIKDNRDQESHYKRFQLILPTDWIYQAIDHQEHNNHFHSMWKGKIQFL